MYRYKLTQDYIPDRATRFGVLFNMGFLKLQELKMITGGDFSVRETGSAFGLRLPLLRVNT